MTTIAKCGTTANPHRVQEINGVGICVDCKAKFIDGIKQPATIEHSESQTNKELSR